MAGRRTYWRGAFPNRFESVVTPNDVDFLTTSEDGPKQASAFICIERLELRGVAQRARREMKRLLMKAPKETWHAPDPNYVGLIWEDENRKDLVGFVAFKVGPGSDDTSRRRTKAPLAFVSFDMQLVFVRPDRRGQGYGTCGACGVAMWLDDCRVNMPRCPRQGTSIVYGADFESLGGEACSSIVLNQFRYYEELRNEAERSSLPWLVRDIIDESGA